MTPKQLEQLAALESKLVDVFLDECKPEQWPTMDSEKGRGDRYWVKKNARATLVIIGQIDRLLADNRGAAKPGAREPEDDIEREAAELEKRGRAVLKKHGKALN